jgi:hypothetical protein
MGKTKEDTTTPEAQAPEPGAPEPEVLDLEVWLTEKGLSRPMAELMRVLYRGQKKAREDWDRALQEALARPVK